MYPAVKGSGYEGLLVQGVLHETNIAEQQRVMFVARRSDLCIRPQQKAVA